MGDVYGCYINFLYRGVEIRRWACEGSCTIFWGVIIDWMVSGSLERCRYITFFSKGIPEDGLRVP